MNPIVNSQNDYFKRDSGFWWRPGRIYIPAWQFAGLDYETTTGTDIKSVGTGTPSATNMILAEINTSGVTGINLNTADNTICHLMEVPYDMDLSFPVYFSIWWTANNTSGTVDWTVFHKAIVRDSTVLGSAEAATALDSVIPVDTMAGVAYTMMRTDEGRMNGGKLADTTEMLNLTVRMHALTTITVPFFVGLSIRYTPHRMYYGSMKVEAKAPHYIAGKTYPN